MPYAHKLDGSHAVRLSDYDPGKHNGFKREDAEARCAELGRELAELQDLLFYAGHHSLLVVLQGRDTSGKDGTIREILTFSNAQSCRVESFKVPTAEELSHDFLWRVHQKAPGKGAITIFNRSHYEDVLVVRVHNLVPDPVWKRRYDHIRNFERLLADNNTLMVKFFLHISKEEQEERLLEREKETEKAWKLNVGDWEERELWDEYTKAYEDALYKCASPEAPWYLVPANHKWYRNLAVLEQLVETLRPYRDNWMRDLEKVGVAAKAELEAYRAEHPRPGSRD
jgi:PPK2 family polyphosphate:nucleotide phosphotransferase